VSAEEVEAAREAGREAGREEAREEGESELNDLLVCLGQEERKVEVLSARLEALGSRWRRYWQQRGWKGRMGKRRTLTLMSWISEHGTDRKIKYSSVVCCLAVPYCITLCRGPLPEAAPASGACGDLSMLF